MDEGGMAWHGGGVMQGAPQMPRVCLRVLLAAAVLAAVEDTLPPVPAPPGAGAATVRARTAGPGVSDTGEYGDCAVRLRGGANARGGDQMRSGSDGDDDEQEEEREGDGSTRVDSADVIDAASVLADWDDTCVAPHVVPVGPVSRSLTALPASSALLRHP